MSKHHTVAVILVDGFILESLLDHIFTDNVVLASEEPFSLSVSLPDHSRKADTGEDEEEPAHAHAEGVSIGSTFVDGHTEDWEVTVVSVWREECL